MTHPATIGRYHVVGRLASGFEQAVVIKRLHPHLAHQPQLAQMFLDEARIVARIHHANVVRIHELGWAEDIPFLAIEYLAGESLHGLMRRLARLDEGMGFATAAHVGAELCAGLHAAHELRGADGEPLGIVHRDVSPQNVFVTYDGAVRLLDFGVALAADRIARTETGHVKGKHAYMSPEQVRGDPLDRRSDIFSAGVVLWELTTGRRLFQRVNELKTMQAVLDRPVPLPSEIVPDYPEVLEDAIMPALERDPARRYPDACEMRRSLVAAGRQLGEALLPEERLASRMHALFAERIVEKEEMLRRIHAGTRVDRIPDAEVDLAVEIPEAPTPVGPPARTRRRRLMGILGLAALALAAASWLGRPPARSPSADVGEKPVAVSPAQAPSPVADGKPSGPLSTDEDEEEDDDDREPRRRR